MHSIRRSVAISVSNLGLRPEHLHFRAFDLGIVSERRGRAKE
jgi:hypothetical protein